VILGGGDAAKAARAAAALWEIWHTAGDPALDALLREGIDALQRQDTAEAIAVFTRLIARAPDYAEGWNKRATARYIAEDYAGAIDDCRETLARKPYHFGALSGQGLCHMALSQFTEAADCFRRTIAVYPQLDNARTNLRAALNELVKWN